MDNQLSRKELQEIISQFADYHESYRTYLHISRNSLTVLWTLFLILPAVAGAVFPSLDLVILGLAVLVGLILLQVMNKLNQWVVGLYLKYLNKQLGQQVERYLKYHKIIQSSIREVLAAGSENYQQALLEKVASKL